MNGINILVALVSLGQAATQPASTVTPIVVIATPTFGADGATTGARMGLPLVQGQSRLVFAASGRSLCQSMSATPQAPTEAGYGWSVDIRPIELTAAGVQVVDVAWQRRWQDGKPSLGSVTRRQIRLEEGAKVQLDYLGAETTTRCEAIGMALELSRPPRPAAGLFEVDAWLIGTGGGDAVQHQVVRGPIGGAAAFYFDELLLDSGKTRAQIEGTFAAKALESGQFDSVLKIARTNPAIGASPSAGSSTFPFKTAPGEVVEFRVPMGGFSLRLRVRQLR